MYESQRLGRIGRRRDRAILALALLLVTACAVAGQPASSCISIEGERVSLSVEHVPLDELLATLNSQLAVPIGVRGEVSGVYVTASMKDTDVREALEQLLADYSYVLIEQRDSSGSERRIELILVGSIDSEAAAAGMPRDAVPEVTMSGPRLEELPAEDLVHAAFSLATPAERAAAVDALAYAASGDSETAGQTAQVLVQALSDADEEVRAQALETLKDTADEIPVADLTQMAREDPSAERRIQALELLVERAEPEAHGPLRLALTDPEPVVSARARELIEDLHIALDGS